MKKLIPVLFIFIVVVVFFWQFFIKGFLPIPADTIIGLYHPFRDLYAKDYPNGIPFKNFLITDPVRQQYLWRELAVSIVKKLELPLWNPYNFAGTPLLANFQSSSFYIFNALFLLMPFSFAWSLIIFLGPLLSGIFLFLYLDNLRLSKWASVLGSISFSFSGFFVAWMEWGTITHVGLWLPLIPLSIDKIVSSVKNKNLIMWGFVYLLSLISAFFAGHLQTFFYLGVFSFTYFIARWLQYGKKVKVLTLYIILNTLYIILTSIQWIPTLQLIFLSARNVDLTNFNDPGWFVPWQNLVQFVAPDFFGNPTTLNYWGVWNYGEFVGYIGSVPLVLAIFAMFFRRDKKALFFGTAFFLSLIFALPTIFAKIPYILQIPILSTSQPTRLLFIVDFCLAVLAALGADYFLKFRRKTILYPIGFIIVVFVGLWLFVSLENILVAKRNIVFPSMIFFTSSILLFLVVFTRKKKYLAIVIFVIIIGVTILDLFRFGWKFTPFTNKDYLFPKTQTISFLQKQKGQFRIATTDSKIFPPNFGSIYRIESIDGYDPLYVRRYAELIAAIERNKPDIDSPFGFNRIITPHNYDSRLIDLLGVKFILSLSDLESEKLIQVFQEEETRIYENKNAMPRAFFVGNVKLAKGKEDAIKMLFDQSINLTQTGIVENGREQLNEKWSIGSANVIQYSENKIIIDTKNEDEGFLILTDTFYPTWKASIDSKLAKLYITDYNFRGMIVPKGQHRIEFYNSLF